MQESKKFLGMETSSLPVIGLLLTLIALFVILSNSMNSNINRSFNRLDSKITEMRIELKSDIREFQEDSPN